MEKQVNGLSNQILEAEFLEKIRSEACQAARELLSAAGLCPRQILVVGCSTSEVAGERIGSFSSPVLGDAVFQGIRQAAQEADIYLAAQCCEHLNRALVMEETGARLYGYEPVNAVPQPKAGGAFATAAWKAFCHPVTLEHIKAHAGMDIGDTLIGMHLRDVAVPVRIPTRFLGSARIICARTRKKFIGGSRALYE